MSKSHVFVMAVVACACVVVLGGCRSTKTKGAGYSDLNPTDISGVDVTTPPGGLVPQPSEIGTRIPVTFENVLFDFDSAKIGNSEYCKIEAVATYLNGNSKTHAVLEGHCDERGTAEYNMTLGERRADAVRAHLLGLKIDAARLFTKSFGEEKPADPGHGESAWRQNRRVEFGLYY